MNDSIPNEYVAATHREVRVYLPRSGPYVVTFGDDKPTAVHSIVKRRGAIPYKRCLWHKHMPKMSITAACAIWAAQTREAT